MVLSPSALFDAAELPGFSRDAVLEVLRVSYLPISLHELSVAIVDLLHRGVASFLAADRIEQSLQPREWSLPQAKGSVVVPLPIIACAAKDARPVGAWLSLQNMLKGSFRSADKDLERICVQADILRFALGFDVVPPALALRMPPKTRTSARTPTRRSPSPWSDESKLRFCFSKTGAVNRVEQDFIYARSKSWTGEDVRSWDRSSVYVAKNPSHPGAEAFYFARLDDAEVLVLHQEKINDDVKAAVDGLNSAAKALQRAGWTSFFVYIIVAMQARSEPKGQWDHPLLFINNTNCDKYFTPSLSILARCLVLRHKQCNESMPTFERQESHTRRPVNVITTTTPLRTSAEADIVSA